MSEQPEPWLSVSLGPASERITQLQRVVTDLCERIAALEAIPRLEVIEGEVTQVWVVAGEKRVLVGEAERASHYYDAEAEPSPAAPSPEPTDAPPRGQGPHDWPEDADDENGQYMNTCACGVTFIGHKRRVVCKVCAALPAPPAPEPTDEDREAARYAVRDARLSHYQCGLGNCSVCTSRPALVELVSRARAEGAAAGMQRAYELFHRLCCLRCTAWTREDDTHPQEYRDGIEKACSDLDHRAKEWIDAEARP